MHKFVPFSTLALVLLLLSGTAIAAGANNHSDHGSMGEINKSASAHQHEIQAMGKLNSINSKKHKVNISHGPIPALSWPPMRMDFSVKKNTSLAGLEPGQKVHFVLMKSGEYEYVITKILPMQ
ncbi:MAG: copper-binding protein [Magnetococcales bacterium]|nr:copper-binding protein [Magnetococcales bacterium]